MNTRSRSVVLLACFLLWSVVAWADVVCDGVDDLLPTGLNLSSFMSASTGTLMLWYTPTGTPQTGGTLCYEGEDVFVSSPTDHWMGLHRNGGMAAGDRICAYNWDFNEDNVQTTYTVNVPTHLAWVHGSGNLSLYKDGVLVNTVASDDTASMFQVVSLCGGGGTGQIAQGTFSEVAIYATAVPASVIANIGQSRLRWLNTLVAASGYWPLDNCTHGASANGVVFADRSGNGRTITGNDGAGNTGLTCNGSTVQTYPWGVD